MNRVEAALALVAERLWPGPGTSPHATPLAEAVYRALEAIADEQAKTDALLREMIKARPDLAREKADAVPPEKFDDEQSRALETRLQVAEQGWASALRRAESAEKKMEAMRAELVESLAQRGRSRSDLEQERDAAHRRAEALEKFKAYVHQRLDEAGVPTHPNGPHSVQGCRIGDRLDLLLRVPRTCTIHIPGHPACDGGPTCSQQAAEAAETWTLAKARRLEQAEADLADASVSLRAALRRAEAVSEKHLDSLRALEAMTARAEDAEKELGHKRNGMTDLSNRLEMTGEELRAAEKERNTLLEERDTLRARVLELKADNAAVRATSLALCQERDALRADCEGLSKLHEQDKAELARWRKAAAELRGIFAQAGIPSAHEMWYRRDHVQSVIGNILDAAEKP